MVQRLKCPKCSTIVTVQPGEGPVCPNCGFGGPARAPAMAPPAPAAAPTYAPVPPAPLPAPPIDATGKPPVQPVSQGVAVTALLLNVLIIPGVGSLVGGRKTEGIWQLVMVGAGVLLLIVFVGFVLIVAAWIWGLVTGVQILQSAKA